MSTADDDVVIVACECGNKFTLPFDCLMFGFDGVFCGQCCETGKFNVENYHPTQEDINATHNSRP